jgi:ABC-type transport system involved in cytochrome c biogenesis permease subunit
MRKFLFALLSMAFLAPALARADIDSASLDSLRAVPVLDHGRIKPFDTVARETVRAVTGSEYFGVVSDGDTQDVSGSVDPVAMVLDWSAHPNQWQTRPVLYVARLDLRTKLGMKLTQKWISDRALATNADFNSWIAALRMQQMTAANNKEKVAYASPSEELLDNAALDLDVERQLFESACDQSLYPVLPTEDNPDVWMPISQIRVDPEPAVQNLQEDWNTLMAAYAAGDGARLDASAKGFRQELVDLSGTQYAPFSRIDREVFYNWFKPFRRTWIIYLVAIVFLIAALMTTNKYVYAAGMSVMTLAILFHIFAFVLRCTITGFAPVATMYETLVWVALMTAVFAYVLEMIYQRRVIAIGGAVIAIVAAIIADNIPANLGASIEPLQPVLRSNYWLTIHVLTIVSSYAAFALSLILGNIVLTQFVWGKSSAESIRTNLLFTYRAIQIGVLLVAAGTILGGLWADVSWGRFWGWDPKEVWALIVLLMYVALLHGRFAGWIKQFGLAAGAVLAFSAVVMSWYGVNFMLGVGLHSYGRGTGGQAWVYSAVAIQWAYVLFAWFVYRARTGFKAQDELATTAGNI